MKLKVSKITADPCQCCEDYKKWNNGEEGWWSELEGFSGNPCEYSTKYESGCRCPALPCDCRLWNEGKCDECGGYADMCNYDAVCGICDKKRVCGDRTCWSYSILAMNSLVCPDCEPKMGEMIADALKS